MRKKSTGILLACCLFFADAVYCTVERCRNRCCGEERKRRFMDEMFQLLKDPLYLREVELTDLPDLDLYMDQIITLFSEKTQDPDGVLTKTMINNYSKEGLLKPIKGKKYSKEHVLQMLLISHLKQTISIQQIKGVMNGISQEAAAQEKSSEQMFREVYSGYLTNRENDREVMEQVLEVLLAKYPADDPESAAKLLMQLSWLSYMAKKMCDALVERRFPLPEKKKEK